MYLSKIILDIRHPSVRQALWDVNDMHRNLMAAFAMQEEQQTPRADQQILFRLFTQRKQAFLLVLSQERPDVHALSARGMYSNDAMIRDISGLKKSLRTGRMLKFELLASPCRKLNAGIGKNSKRAFLKTEEERADWLKRKGEQGGFQVVQVEEIGSRVDLEGHRKDAAIKNSGVIFSGILKIIDEEAFWQTYIHGIGPGKAYGLGMLNLAST